MRSAFLVEQTFAGSAHTFLTPMSTVCRQTSSNTINNSMSLGLYISVPFCRTKCSYCNFASDVFSKSAYENYVARLLDDIAGAQRIVSEIGCILPETVDSIYLGGGTPSILDPGQL